MEGRYGHVTVLALVFGEILQSLGLVADGAAKLEIRGAHAVSTLGMGAMSSSGALDDDGVAKVLQLTLGEEGLRAEFLANVALDSSRQILAAGNVLLGKTQDIYTHLSGMTTLSILGSQVG